MVGYQVVSESTINFKTDILPLSRSTHPSGVLHVSRTISPAKNTKQDKEEHAFAWIVNSLHIDAAIPHLEKAGFDKFVFIPYSTKENWLERYVHAPLVLECNESGKVVGELWQDLSGGAGKKEENTGVNDDEEDDVNVPKTKKRKKGRLRSMRRSAMLHGVSSLPNAERDELHIEIYNYFSWLHSKLVDLERKAEMDLAAKATEASDDEADAEEDDGVDSEGVTPKKRKKMDPVKKLNPNKSIDVAELQGVMEKMEYAFLVVPSVKLEAAAAAAAAAEEEGEESAAASLAQRGVPFLEEALQGALIQLVEVRESAGKPKRSRKQQKRPKLNISGRIIHDWNDHFERLVTYQEERGNCLVPTKYKEDPELGKWVRYMREKMTIIKKKGLEFEEPKPGRLIAARTLTAERIEKLNSIGFVWSILPPTVCWEDRFQELMEYYYENGKWPSQSMGSLGEFVHTQRQLFSLNNVNFMKNRAPKLDEVGFEWTPRGNTKLKWEDGFEMLMAFGRIHGHFDVPCPPPNEDGKNNTKADPWKLYAWVNSLHGMYRSYKLGRQAGSLDDERVVLLIKHGFVFKRT